MKKIYLICSAGMSTSMLASRMQSVADASGEDLKIEAFPHSQLKKIVKNESIDCLLLGPQIRHMVDDIKSEYKESGFAIGVVDAMDYGMMDGEKVLNNAIRLMNEKK